MRKYYLIAYDISDPKRLRQVYRTMRGYGDPLQYSVFICNLSGKEKVLMLTHLEDIINHVEDRIMVVDLGNSDEECKRIEFFGRQSSLPERQAVIV